MASAGPVWIKWLRDLVLFFVATGLLIFEAVVRTGEPRLAFLLVYGSILGVPGVSSALEAWVRK
ncbi:MAG: hypothetical protein WAT66_04375 [Actinomycetota bacterium]